MCGEELKLIVQHIEDYYLASLSNLAEGLEIINA